MMKDFTQETSGASKTSGLACPICGTPLVVGLLGIPEDDGEVVTLFTFDCPTGDFHTAMRETEVRQMFAREVVRRLRLLEADS